VVPYGGSPVWQVTARLRWGVPLTAAVHYFFKLLNFILLFAEETVILLKNGSEIKYGGAPGAFEREFVYMETILEEVRRIIAGSNISVEGLENLMDKLQQLRYVLVVIVS